MQLGSSGTTYNVTLNLTGHILMGLGIATSLVFYMFLNALNSRSSGGYGYGHERAKVKQSHVHTHTTDTHSLFLCTTFLQCFLMDLSLVTIDSYLQRDLTDIDFMSYNLTLFEEELDAFEAQMRDTAMRRKYVIKHPDCFTQATCYLSRKPGWSQQWRNIFEYLTGLVVHTSSSN